MEPNHDNTARAAVRGDLAARRSAVTLSSSRPEPERVVLVRRVRPQFEKVELRLWFRGDRFRTALFNAYTMLLGDEFEFVAIMRRYLPAVQEESLRLQLKGWLGQEAAHGVQHRNAYDYLDRMRLRYRSYHAVENFVYFHALFPILGARQRVALVAGLEHFNTLIGEMCLRPADYFAGADPELSLLLTWHFAEEIEHRAVVHDVAQELEVGYFTRVLTGVLAFVLYSSTLLVTAFWFAFQTGDVLRLSTYRTLYRFLFVEERFVFLFCAYAREYLSPRFHPLNRRTDAYAERALLSVPVAKRDAVAVAVS